MPISERYKQTLNKHWKILQGDSRNFANRQKKVARNIPNHAAELAAIEQFIKEKGITKCESPIPDNSQPFSDYAPAITVNWKG